MGELCTAPIETQPGVMFTGPNWKQLGSVGSQAAPSWTTALPSGGWAGVSRPYSPSRPGTWEPPRNTHPAQSRHPHPQARPPRRSPRGLLSAPGNALRTRRARPAARLTPRGTGVQRSARAVSSMRSISRPRGTFVGVAPNTDGCRKLNRQDVATSVQGTETAITCGASALLRHEKL